MTLPKQVLGCTSFKAQPDADAKGSHGSPLGAGGGDGGKLATYKAQKDASQLLFCTNGPLTPSPLCPFAYSSDFFVLFSICVYKPRHPFSLSSNWLQEKQGSIRADLPGSPESPNRVALGFFQGVLDNSLVLNFPKHPCLLLNGDCLSTFGRVKLGHVFKAVVLTHWYTSESFGGLVKIQLSGLISVSVSQA